MKGKPRKAPCRKDQTSRYLAGDVDEDRVDSVERFGDRTRQARQTKFAKTASLQADSAGHDIDTLPIGLVVQVFSLFCEVEHEKKRYLCVVRKTITKLAETGIVVGDRVRFRPALSIAEQIPGAARLAAGRLAAGRGRADAPPPNRADSRR